VNGGTAAWPAMDSYPFAHTSPVWFGALGSTQSSAARRAAVDLLAALDVAEGRVQQAYKEAPATTILGRIAEARQKLQALAR
jgi:TolB protein